MSQQTALAVEDEEPADDAPTSASTIPSKTRRLAAALAAAIRRRARRRGSAILDDGTEARVDAIGAATAAASPQLRSEPNGSAPQLTGLRRLLISGLLMCLALGGLVGWLAVRTHHSRAVEHRRELFLEVGRQGAVNLTTIDYTHVEADIQRVLDGSTGTFYDDFRQRSPAFAEVVKRAKSITVGTVTAAGLESVTAESAQVLVTVSVRTSNTASAEQQPRHWRMRIDVQGAGDGAKVSKVVFVP